MKEMNEIIKDKQEAIEVITGRLINTIGVRERAARLDARVSAYMGPRFATLEIAMEHLDRFTLYLIDDLDEAITEAMEAIDEAEEAELEQDQEPEPLPEAEQDQKGGAE